MNSKLPSNNISGFKGVHWDKERSKWAAEVKKDYKKHHLGRFLSKIEAAEAYNEAALRLHGEFAWLNEIPDEEGIKEMSCI